MRNGGEWTSTIQLDVQPKLLLGWRPRARRIVGAVVELHEETYGELLAVAGETLQALATLEPIEFGDEVLPTMGEEYMRRRIVEIPLKSRTNAGVPGADGPSAGDDPLESDNDEQVADLLRLVEHLETLEVLPADQLREGEFAFYAICLPQPDGETVTLIRGMNPAKVLRRAAFFGRHQGVLRKAERPDLLLESEVDLVVTREEIALLRRSTYDRLFSDLDELAAAVPSDVKALGEALPHLNFAPGTDEVLEKLCGRLPSLAKRLHRLAARGDLYALTPDKLRAALMAHGEQPGHWLDQDDALTLTEERAKHFLDVVEGRWWTSDFTGERRRADAFRKRR